MVDTAHYYRVASVCCRTTLQKVNVQQRSFTEQLIQFKLMQRRLIAMNVHFICLHRLIYRMCIICMFYVVFVHARH